MGHGTAAVSGLVVSVVRALVLVGVVLLWVRRMVVVDDSVALVLDDPRRMSVPWSSLDIADAEVVVVADDDVGAPNNSVGTGLAAAKD